jgi:parvulin-like peptidyl-prolyl isomerase
MLSKKRTTIATILTAFLLFFSSAKAEVLDGIAANANGKVITISELKSRLVQLKLDNKKAMEVLDKMIEEAIVEDEIQKKGFAATKAEIDEANNLVLRQNGLHAQTELQALLKQQGLTEEQFRTNLKTQIERSKFANFMAGGKIKVDQAEIKKFYEEHYLHSQLPNQLSLRSIFIATKLNDSTDRKKGEKQSQDLLARLKKGENFAKLAKKFSAGPTASAGGVMGDFRKEELQDDFQQALDALKPGQFSGVIQHPEGFYILKLDDLKKSPAPSLKQVEGEIMQRLQAREMDRLFRIWMQQARDKAFIDIRIKELT